MLFNHFKLNTFACCLLLGSAVTNANQMIPIKSNMGQPSEIFVKRALMEDLSPSATESNLYFLPIRHPVNLQYDGEIYVNQSTGFSISEAKQSLNYSSIELTSPTGEKYSVQNNQIICQTSACTLGSVNVSIHPSSKADNAEIRTISINSENKIKGRWEIKINDLPKNVSDKDFLVTHEDSVVLALRDSDQISLVNRSNKFVLELREPPKAFTHSMLEPSTDISQDTYTTINGSEIKTLNAIVTVVPRSSDTLPLDSVTSSYKVVISPEGEISTTIPGLPVGNYSLEVDFTAFMVNGDVIQRTAYYGFPVIDSSVVLTGNSSSKVLDHNRMEISLDVNAKDSQTNGIVLIYAEIWSGDKPVSFINTMANIDQNSRLSVTIDSRWFALANATNDHNFEFKNIKLMDPDTYLVIDEMKSLKVAVSRFPDAAYAKASEITIDDGMMHGKNDVLLSLKGTEVKKGSLVKEGTQAKNSSKTNHLEASGIFLVHGWCSSTNAWNANNFNDGPREEYSNTNNPSIGRNDFAIAIRNQANSFFTDWFSVVAHSQGGQAAVHLQAYFFSGLDSSPAPRPIQTLGTPYLGSTIMDLYVFSGVGILNAIFSAHDCGAQISLTTTNSYLWNIFLPITAQSKTFYYRTIHDLPNNFWEGLQFWRWKCNSASYILSGVDDGVTRPFKSWLLFGNDMGITEGQCHMEMRFPDQKDDLGRNDIMDQMGRVTGTWTAWFDRDDPSGSGDWEQRSSNTGVCANPIDYQARRVSDGTAANLTGELFSSNSPFEGLVCRKADQPDNTCFDYEVRFLCP